MAGPDYTDPAFRFAKPHGYLFQTPVERGPNQLEVGVPIKAAGRFSHEAAAVDQRSGIVYETEDPGSGVGAGFYRYTPRKPDDLAKGGVLEMLAIAGRRNVDLREGRKRGRAAARALGPDQGARSGGDQRRRCDSTFNQGWEKGGAKFNRLEGCWEDDGTIFFVSTSGGDVKNGDVNSDGYAEGFGQVWAYRPGAAEGPSPSSTSRRPVPSWIRPTTSP